MRKLRFGNLKDLPKTTEQCSQWVAEPGLKASLWLSPAVFTALEVDDRMGPGGLLSYYSMHQERMKGWDKVGKVLS